MDEMQKLYDAKEYDQVVELLLKAVTQPSQKPMVGRFCLILKELKSFDVPVYLALLKKCMKWEKNLSISYKHIMIVSLYW